MDLRDIFRVNRKTFFDPFGWVDYDYLKAQNKTIFSAIKALFQPDRAHRTETFEQAIKRLGLTEKDIQETTKNYQFYAFLFLLLGLLCFIYAFYILFSSHSFAGWLLGIGAAGLFFAQAYKYDFWSYQIQKRKLGMTFGEWAERWLGKPRGPQ